MPTFQHRGGGLSWRTSKKRMEISIQFFFLKRGRRRGLFLRYIRIALGKIRIQFFFFYKIKGGKDKFFCKDFFRRLRFGLSRYQMHNVGTGLKVFNFTWFIATPNKMALRIHPYLDAQQKWHRDSFFSHHQLYRWGKRLFQTLPMFLKASRKVSSEKMKFFTVNLINTKLKVQVLFGNHLVLYFQKLSIFSFNFLQ